MRKNIYAFREKHTCFQGKTCMLFGKNIYAYEEDFTAFFQKTLSRWYTIHHRTLPWRETKDPYRIWISEIILQQTRVDQGWEYYLRFTNALPDIHALAAADEEEVLKLWQGLGYYSRARNLHATAKRLVSDYGGAFPPDHSAVLSLKGIGEYTAAAICSFAWDLPFAAVDGNVYRVLARLFAIDTPIDSGKGKREFAELARVLLNKDTPGLHNQAVMELGALQCVPQKPDCPACPFAEKCAAYAEGDVSLYPVKQHKTKVRHRHFHYFHIQYKDKILLHRRGEKDIWQGLYELPLIETDTKMDFSELQKTTLFGEWFAEVEGMHTHLAQQGTKHVLSHQVLLANFYQVRLDILPEKLQHFRFVSAEEAEEMAMPRLIEAYFGKNNGYLLF